MKHIKNIFLRIIGFTLLLFLASSCEDEEVNKSPQANFELDATSVLEQGKTIKFTNLSEDALSYLWSFGDGDTYVGIDAEHAYEAAGTYRVVLEASAEGQRSVFALEVTIKANEYELYFIDNDALKVRKFKISTPNSVEDVFDLPGITMGLAYDDINNEIYYSDDDNQILYKNNLSGTAQTEIASGFSAVRDIALDVANNKVYIADKNADAIKVVDLSTQNVTTLYSVSDDPLFLLPVGLDLYNNELYITAVDFDAETVWKGNIDGSGISKIIDYNSGGFGYGISIDALQEKIYFDDADGGNILRADLDGSNIETFGGTADRVYGVTVISDLEKVVWASRDGKINISNLDKSENSVLTDLEVDIRGIFARKVN